MIALGKIKLDQKQYNYSLFNSIFFPKLKHKLGNNCQGFILFHTSSYGASTVAQVNKWFW